MIFFVLDIILIAISFRYNSSYHRTLKILKVCLVCATAIGSFRTYFFVNVCLVSVPQYAEFSCCYGFVHGI